ncbi:autotransporter outer membrane beta-barrel domain-containing protein [Pantoea dispersa]|uniref:autotransporter outer membrane beta-barrel domain-containing protein n=1 Tax=Pantoea dispersa TaxID=59814 RepID=UPI0024AEC187|nr:autotransporter outer membrane beta-barrel domain-containing protein [Pantoea dispersa]MDI6636470.1 autotransporter outer membrane beta-barrel domain-containing protein [Pantoea dispersa]
MKKNNIAIFLSLISGGAVSVASASNETVYDSGSAEYASLLTYSERFNTSSSFLITGPETSVKAKYSSSSPSSGTINIGNGAAPGDTDAYMLIKNGASVFSDQNMFIGSVSDLASYVTVSGQDSTLITPQIIVGNSGGGKNNALNITDGGQATAFDVYAGYGANGTINVNGESSVLNIKPGIDASGTVTKQLTIGSGGYTGVLNVSEGGVVNVSDGAMLSLGGTGNGSGGSGTLNISSGGVVNAGTVAGGNSIDSSDINILVNGAGSALNLNTFYLGADEGTAKTTVSDGASITVADKLYLSASMSGIAVVNIESGGTLSVGGENGIVYGGSSTPAIFNLNGGILKAYKSFLTTSININLLGNSISSLDTNGVGMSVSGVLSGTGSLIKSGAGTLTLSAKNTYTGDTKIEGGTLETGVENSIASSRSIALHSGATLDLGGYNQKVNSLTGAGNILLGINTLDEINIAGTETTFSGVISGDGNLSKTGEGNFILTGSNTYTGSTTINGGTLKTGVEDAFASTSGVNVADIATLNLAGYDQTVTSLNNSGTVLINDAGAGVLAKVVTLYGNMINSGLVVINNGATNAGQTLAVKGDWNGNGGAVSIGTVLGGDDSFTDKLVISGNASGTTYVSVANEGGTGAQTLEGIELISTGSSTADAFVQSRRVVAGSYEYHLQQGSASGANMNNWYLTSQSENGGGNGDTEHTYRPERGSYASNLQAAATMFSMRLKDRQGGSVYTDPVTGERHESSLWVRSVGGHTEGRLSDGQSKYSANRMVFQLGGNVLKGSQGADDAWHLGLMGGYGKQNSNTHNNLSGYHSKGSVWGYSTGIYATWYQNAKDKTGLYADSWLSWNWFDNSVKGDELSYEKYKSKGLMASLETGYAFHTGSYMTSGGTENNIYVTPQAQVLWSGVKADNHTEANGTTVKGRGSDNVQTRLGVRLSMTGQSHLDKDSVRQFEPFLEANWVYTAKDYGVKMGDNSAYIQGYRNVAELKTGVEGHVTENLSVWGSVAQQIGGNNYQDTQGVLGLNYSF